MKIRINNLLILVGALLALFGAARAAPNFVQAFSERGEITYPNSSPILWPDEIQPLLPPTPISYELDPIEGLSTSFTARMAGLPVETDSSPVENEIRAEVADSKIPFIQDQPAAAPPALSAPTPGEIPVRLIIPSINLDAPVLLSEADTLKIRGEEYLSWRPPDLYAAGWHNTSALLGEPGNTVLSGHHNIYGEVFRNLIDVEVGDAVVVLGPTEMYLYVVANKMLVPEKYEQIDTRMENARWILGTDDERLTLITCWPYETNTHRLILVASPVNANRLK
jgi:LPXTG-site transpeptidase (sortase) family protein